MRAARILGIAVLLLFLAGAVSAEEEELVWKIAFQAEGAIHVMNADGANRTHLTNTTYPNGDRELQWSPDGTQIAFHSNRDGNWEIYAMNSDGSNQTRLTNNSERDREPQWSPDGTQIAFWSERDGIPKIYVMDAGGSNQTNLTQNARHEFTPQWSPDGTRIAFESNNEIYVMDADGSNPMNLTESGSMSFPPDPPVRFNLEAQWSPNGTRIAFESLLWEGGSQPTSYSIYVVDADGRNKKDLTENISSDDYEPQWSPDGTQIAFHSNRDGNREIYVMDADGNSQTNLTGNLGNNWSPRWSPDGAKIAFWSIGGPSGIYVMNPDGSNQTNLTGNDLIGGGFPEWSPVKLLAPEPTSALLQAAALLTLLGLRRRH